MPIFASGEEPFHFDSVCEAAPRGIALNGLTKNSLRARAVLLEHRFKRYGCVPCRLTRRSDWLGLARVSAHRRHLEVFPASSLLLRWHIFDVSSHPPNVTTRVFDATIPFTRRQRHQWKNGNSAGVKRRLIDRVAIGHIQVN